MKRAVACVVLAVAVTGCGGSSDENDAALQRMAELEAELEAQSEQTTTLAPMTMKAPATTMTVSGPIVQCRVYNVLQTRAYWEASIVNVSDVRTKYRIYVDVYYDGDEWIGSGDNITDETPPGQRAIARYPNSTNRDGPGDLEKYSCEVYMYTES